jgi:hypothetical protein
MTSKLLPRFKYGLVCDDIREEKSNKTLIVGLYGSKIIVPGIPGVMPKLCFRLCFDATRTYPEAFDILIRKPDGKVDGPFPVKAPRLADEEEGYINISLVPFPIGAEGHYEVLAANEGREAKVLTFRVVKGTLPA